MKFLIALIIILIFKKDLMRNLFPENIFQAALENVQTVQRNHLNTSDSMYEVIFYYYLCGFERVLFADTIRYVLISICLFHKL